MPLSRFGNRRSDEPFFSLNDYAVFSENKVANSRFDQERNRVRDKFLALHNDLYPEIKRREWDLHPHWHAPNIVSTWYISRVEQIWFMKLRYLRSRDEVKALEKADGHSGTIGLQRNPVYQTSDAGCAHR